jgi:hypothetical protein
LAQGVGPEFKPQHHKKKKKKEKEKKERGMNRKWQSGPSHRSLYKSP